MTDLDPVAIARDALLLLSSSRAAMAISRLAQMARECQCWQPRVLCQLERRTGGRLAEVF
jgi:hypothetical protein